MPMQRTLYPRDWEAIARSIKRGAAWHCEHCLKPCMLPREDWLDFVLRMGWSVGEAIAYSAKPRRYQLGTAHLNHVPSDCSPANLRAWCTVCHCRYDLAQMGTKKRLKRERNGQIPLQGYLVPPRPAGRGKDPTRIQMSIPTPL